VTAYLLFGGYGFEFTINRWDILTCGRTLFSFRIFGGNITYPWFKYRITSMNGILQFELGHGELQSTWIAQGPIKRIA
jgi:hypothetical protein